MVTATSTASVRKLPEGYHALPITVADSQSSLRLCAVVRHTPEPSAGHLVLLADLHDALVYLGCVADAAGAIREWIEIRVQNVDGLASSLPAHKDGFSNHSLDDRWKATAGQMRELDPGACLTTGLETKHPSPCYFDLAEGKPVTPGAADASGAWELCQADELLKAAGLPPYSTSLFRYLYQPAAGAESAFVPVVAGAPGGPRTRSPVDAFGKPFAQHVPFNPQAGLLFVSSLFPIPFEDYVDLLGGKPWKGIPHGKRNLMLDPAYHGLEDWNQMLQNAAHLFLGNRGHHGYLSETFHLKVQLLHDMLRQIRACVQAQQIPFLNLDKDSFRVRLGETGGGLPYLWTASCQLAKPSHAFALPVESSDFRYFVRARVTGPTIYLPEGLGDSLQGSGSVRLRKVNPPESGRTVIEGTLVTQEKLGNSPNDLLWLRLPLPTGRVDLYGHIYPGEGLAPGEVRFRTIPQRLPDDVVQALKAAEGVAFARSPFEVVPLLSTPCDLYSFAALAVRALLVNEEATLAVSLDEVQSLARQLAANPDPSVPLAQRIRALFEKDDRFRHALGPHRLIRAKLDAGQAFHAFPADLWYDTLAILVRLFPGLGPDSVCKDFGDVPALALETAFDQPLEAFETLLIRSRSLIVIDWNANREVHNAIQSYLDRSGAA